MKITVRLRRSGSKLRYYSSFVPRGLRIIRHEGWGSFRSKSRRKFKTWRDRRMPPDRLYRRWMACNEPGPEAIEKQRQDSLCLEFHPKISLVALVSVTESEQLRLTVSSVLGQTYGRWELCLVVKGPFLQDAASIMPEYASADSRIRVKFLASDRDTSQGFSEALSLASGEFIGLLDQGDELAPSALFEVVKLLNAKPELDFIYSDEDRTDSRRKRSAPFFKPDWSPDMLLSWPYIGRLAIYRKKLLDSNGGFRDAHDGCREYDLVLKVTETTDRIFHIPQVLYHRRAPPLPPREQLMSRSDDLDKKALSAYLKRNNIEGKVCDGLWPGSYRVKREIAGSPLVSIIVPTRDHPAVLKRCIDSILGKTAYSSYEILVVDNQSTQSDELRSYYRELEKLENIRLLSYNQPFNFAALNNYAVSEAKGKYILFLNSDIEVISEEWLSAMLEQAQRKEVGAAGAKLLFPDGSIQHCGVILGLGVISAHPYRMYPDRPGYFGRVDSIIDCSAVTAACLLLRKEVFREVAGFDENLAVDYNDIDLCLKLREKGYLIVYTPYARLFHLESYVRGYAASPERKRMHLQEIEYFNSKWGGLIEKGDPYYNPNLSLTRLDFAIEPECRRVERTTSVSL